jgi:predicted RNA binding protein YcfA (HicA-like mRNA interferase family)
MEKAWMPVPETSRAKVVKRLEREGWINEGGGKHDIFRHPVRGLVFALPRHRTLSPGIARDLARVAGW